LQHSFFVCTGLKTLNYALTLAMKSIISKAIFGLDLRDIDSASSPCKPT